MCLQVLRLDRGAIRRERALALAGQVPGGENLGVHERSILAKYGSDNIFQKLDTAPQGSEASKHDDEEDEREGEESEGEE
jgi:hypothetical protein